MQFLTQKGGQHIASAGRSAEHAWDQGGQSAGQHAASRQQTAGEAEARLQKAPSVAARPQMYILCTGSSVLLCAEAAQDLQGPPLLPERGGSQVSPNATVAWPSL